MSAPLVPDAVRQAFAFSSAIAPLGGGLINATFAAQAEGRAWILQRVNPIFAPENHTNILAVTQHLAARGLRTPQLRPTRSGAPYLVHEAQTWRAMDRIAGHAHDAVSDPAQALAAASFVASWHEACTGLEHEFVATRQGVHDTPAHLQRLRAAIDGASGHRLREPVQALGNTLLAQANALDPLPELALPVAHGDLKLNNLIFESASPDSRALALIDLDTVAPMSLAHEMGDALRSWCNRAGEDQLEAQLDADLARQVSTHYLRARGLLGSSDACEAMLLGPEWISLELCARFLADAIFEDYFGWDATRFAGRGEHNLVRARGQWSLYQAFASSRAQRKVDTST